MLSITTYTSLIGCLKNDYKIEYIVACEPQSRGAWHMHLIIIFDRLAPFIPNATIETLWEQGFTKTTRLENIDNIGAYLTAYLGDMEYNEENVSELKKQGLELSKMTLKQVNEIEGIKLNDLNSVLLYIINVTESQNGFFSHQDLDTFLIRFASKYQKPSTIPELVRAKIFEGFKNCLTFFSDYRNIRNDLINNKEDKFNCHSLSKKSIDINDFYFKEVSINFSILIFNSVSF